MKRDGWYVVAVREELLFRGNTADMWNELVLQASGERAGAGINTKAAFRKELAAR